LCLWKPHFPETTELATYGELGKSCVPLSPSVMPRCLGMGLVELLAPGGLGGWGISGPLHFLLLLRPPGDPGLQPPVRETCRRLERPLGLLPDPCHGHLFPRPCEPGEALNTGLRTQVSIASNSLPCPPCWAGPCLQDNCSSTPGVVTSPPLRGSALPTSLPITLVLKTNS
jgi:hypothetical protein